MASNIDQISLPDLALILRSAAESQARGADAELMSVLEAERIAEEIGITPPEFGASLRALQSLRAGGSGVMGPDSIITAESHSPVAVGAADAARMLTAAHICFPIYGEIGSPAEGTWRTANRSTF